MRFPGGVANASCGSASCELDAGPRHSSEAPGQGGKARGDLRTLAEVGESRGPRIALRNLQGEIPTATQVCQLRAPPRA
jgi:hypothetical protein